MLFEKILMKFAAEIIPKMLPGLLRMLADRIESGAVTVEPETVLAMLAAYGDHVKQTASEMAK